MRDSPFAVYAGRPRPDVFTADELELAAAFNAVWLYGAACDLAEALALRADAVRLGIDFPHPALVVERAAAFTHAVLSDPILHDSNRPWADAAIAVRTVALDVATRPAVLRATALVGGGRARTDLAAARETANAIHDPAVLDALAYVVEHSPRPFGDDEAKTRQALLAWHRVRGIEPSASWAPAEPVEEAGPHRGALPAPAVAEPTPEVPAGIDFGKLVDALRAARNPAQAKLVAYMADKDKADVHDVARDVHGSVHPGKDEGIARSNLDAVRKRASAVNKSLLSMRPRPPLSFKVVGDPFDAAVFKVVSSE